MTVKKTYAYFFYKIYKSIESTADPLKSDYKAILGLVALEAWLYLSILFYMSAVFKSNFLRDDTTFVVCMIMPLPIIILIKYSVFEKRNAWKRYIKEFDRWPKRKNIKGGVIVWSVIVMIFLNLVLSLYADYLVFRP